MQYLYILHFRSHLRDNLKVAIALIGKLLYQIVNTDMKMTNLSSLWWRQGEIGCEIAYIKYSDNGCCFDSENVWVCVCMCVWCELDGAWHAQRAGTVNTYPDDHHDHLTSLSDPDKWTFIRLMTSWVMKLWRPYNHSHIYVDLHHIHIIFFSPYSFYPHFSDTANVRRVPDSGTRVGWLCKYSFRTRAAMNKNSHNKGGSQDRQRVSQRSEWPV